jgi:hypothetical protein
MAVLMNMSHRILVMSASKEMPEPASEFGSKLLTQRPGIIQKLRRSIARTPGDVSWWTPLMGRIDDIFVECFMDKGELMADFMQENSTYTRAFEKYCDRIQMVVRERVRKENLGKEWLVTGRRLGFLLTHHDATVVGIPVMTRSMMGAIDRRLHSVRLSIIEVSENA